MRDDISHTNNHAIHISREKIEAIRQGYLTMLRRYMRQEHKDAGIIMEQAVMIINIIPRLSDLFRRMGVS